MVWPLVAVVLIRGQNVEERGGEGYAQCHLFEGGGKGGKNGGGGE